MTDTQSLSDLLREDADTIEHWGEGGRRFMNYETLRLHALKAADALDQQAAEITLMKDGRQLHDELIDYLEHVIAQAVAALKQIVDIGDASSGSDRGDLVTSREIARKVLVTLSVLIPENKTEESHDKG